tara:strand:- start:404 stop:601 length:198 start_codon:yes stop_codon:yes gene_type:complete
LGCQYFFCFYFYVKAAFCLFFLEEAFFTQEKENEARKRVIETMRANAHIRSVYHVLCRENAVDVR